MTLHALFILYTLVQTTTTTFLVRTHTRAPLTSLPLIYRTSSTYCCPIFDKKILQNEISTALGSAYLSEKPHLTRPHTTVDGIMFGIHNRIIFPLVTNIHKSRLYVIYFLYNSGSPFTLLLQEVYGVPKYFTYNH